jgi:hypothetical protein
MKPDRGDRPGETLGRLSAPVDPEETKPADVRVPLSDGCCLRDRHGFRPSDRNKGRQGIRRSTDEPWLEPGSSRRGTRTAAG